MSNISMFPMRALFASSALCALIATGFGGAALAAGANAQITGNGFSPAVIKVISENGTSWTKIEERPLALPVHIVIGMDDHLVNHYEVRQPGLPANGIPMISASPNAPSVNISPSPIGKTEFMTAAERQSIIQACNAKLAQGGDIHQDQNLFTGVGVRLTAQFYDTGHGGPLDASGLGAPHVSNGSVTVPVLCQAAKRPPAHAGDVTTQAPSFKVKGINLRFATTAHYPTKPNPGTQCKVAKAKIRVQTSKAGAVKVKLWTKGGDGQIKSEVVDAWAKFTGPGTFEASFQKVLTVSKTMTVQAMAEDMINPIGLSTGWKSVKVRCTGAGGGGLTTGPNTSNPDQAQSAKKPGLAANEARKPARKPGRLIGQRTKNQDNAAQSPRQPRRLRVVDDKARAKDRFERTKVHVR